MVELCAGHANTHTNCTKSLMQDLAGQDLTKEQMSLVGKGYAGPPVLLGANSLTEAQVFLSHELHCHTWMSLRQPHPDLQGKSSSLETQVELPVCATTLHRIPFDITWT